jgi:hypothetical protein
MKREVTPILKQENDAREITGKEQTLERSNIETLYSYE